MQKKLRAFYLLIKKNLSSPAYLAMLLMLMLLQFLLANIHLPGNELTNIGFYYNKSEYGQKIVEDLNNTEVFYNIIICDSEEELTRQVKAGLLECGFVFPDDFDRNLQRCHLTESVKYISSPYTQSGLLFQEKIYSCIYNYYSDYLLVYGIEEYYDEFTPEMKERLLELNRKNLTEENLFSVSIEGLKDYDKNQSVTGKNNRFYELMFCLIIFICMYLTIGEKWSVTNHYRDALPRKSALFFFYMELIASGFIPYVIGILFLHNIYFIVHGFIILILGAVWCVIASKPLNNHLSYLGTIPAIIILNLIMCPYIIDLGTYVIAVRYIKYFFPLGWM